MTTRRGFLGAVLAAAAAPAIVRAGSLMPIYVPPQRIITPLLFNGGMMWQDAARTVPVTTPGQPVAAVERMILANGVWHPASQQSTASRPTAGVAGNGDVYLQFDPTDDYMTVDVPQMVVVEPPSNLFIGRRSNMPAVKMKLYRLEVNDHG